MKLLMAGKKHSDIKDLEEKAVCMELFFIHTFLYTSWPNANVAQMFQRVSVTLEGFACFYFKFYTKLHHPVIMYDGQIEK